MISTKVLKKILRYIIHLFFWIGVYHFYTFFLGYGTNNTTYVSQFSYYLMPVTMVFSYFIYYYLEPNYLKNNRVLLFLLYLFYTFIIANFFISLSILYGFVFNFSLLKGSIDPLTKSIPFILMGVYFVFLFVVFIAVLESNYRNTIRNQTLQKQFYQASLQFKEQELSYLKSQIHPHFLFNTLNAIYGYALLQSEKAPDMILKLSSLLDYILYQVEKPFVFLENEITHIEDYIALEKMRFQEQLKVSVQVEEMHSSFQIAPMLLLPFIENAFKHGAILNGELVISISITTINNSLIFNCVNSAVEAKEIKEGIGLTNIQNRLKMLYKENYSLQLGYQNASYMVELVVPLSYE